MFLGVLMAEDVDEIPQSLCTDILGGLFNHFPDVCQFHWSVFLMGKTYNCQSCFCSPQVPDYQDFQILKHSLKEFCHICVFTL